MLSGSVGLIVNPGMKTMPNDFDRLGPDIAFRPRIPKKESIVALNPQSKRLHRDGRLTMADIPLPWRAYAAHQSDLDSRTSVNATSWGVEEGLNYLLEGENLGSHALDVDRIIANAARRDRYARSLLAKHIIIHNEVDDSSGQIEARSSLALLQRQMPTTKLALLIELAKGTKPADLAEGHRVDVGTLRTRVARARQVARAMAA
ncbi:MAG: hypothetical protein EOS64_09205 [Mesorhizobium sp.]|nr:MAG: hypothetical protein EOS64_09205 [Mesorhizobium sp.]